ncbi:alpha-L-rhamnosidase C-terminal domain-containing protein [Plebeiibacterium sediminum]|uniref:Alpha-L-rhamnosidase N-terminal domain-containing protein n=1 Tax=Plebeiibacterium sediminum TaxID=2992112 RepID=A0AAE3M589_9BACT|nr:alpha-L-rhamnosidase C-terminal domain-containing protein [Plebeiobacterium sediminum]MCW3787313.1 alpha-L-rhamnosidase N-terminal domain-containing protein [Plebeiobacterium sediminum]
MKYLIVTVLVIFSLQVSAQFGESDPEWDASWIYLSDNPDNEYGLYLFRKVFQLQSVPESFNVRVSADNRYKLYVNEILVSQGPVIGDIKHWNYETVDLAPYLKAGNNIIAAKVWNEGALRPVFQFSKQTAFLLQGTNEQTKKVNTNNSWKCIEDKSYTPIKQNVLGYYAAGAGEKIDMNFKVDGWKQLNFDDSSWSIAQGFVDRAFVGFGFNTRQGWTLIPSIIPPMELTKQRLQTIRNAKGVQVPESFLSQSITINIPANTTAQILLDQSFLTNAYPTLIFSKGKNSTVVITYSEGLYDSNGAKNNRNNIEGKTISGRQDTIISNGKINQNFTSLSWRTYRYVQLEVKTQTEPLVINDFYGTFTGYPFKLNAKVEVDHPEINKILEIGWRTARLCAVETYMDCPYYERLQYIGDARIQMMISYYNSGDDRLAKYALNLWDNSRKPDGYTLSRYPDTQGQVIPPYSLWHVSALYDYMMMGDDPEFVKAKLLGTRQILNYFITHIAEDGSLKHIPGWNFTDWVPTWDAGVAPMDDQGNSSLLDLQLLLALQSGQKLEETEGAPEYARLYADLSKKLAETIKEKYWDAARNLYADTPQKNSFSQHANTLAILAGLTDEETSRNVAQKMLSDNTLTQASIYFKYYLHQALAKAGLGDHYLNWLDIWRKNIDLGLTTWGETSEVETTRSDCHAWGSSPNIEIYRTILGIESAAPYFSKVKIEPQLGDIKNIKGEIPHPKGNISVAYKKMKNKIKAEIHLPDGVNGIFIWKGRQVDLKAGMNQIEL